MEDYRLPSNKTAHVAYAEQVGADGAYQLKCLAESAIAEEDLTLSEDSIVLRWQSNQELTVRAPFIFYTESPYDTEVRYRRRCGTIWTDYITHLSGTCDDDSFHLVTHVTTTYARGHEAQCIEGIYKALIAKKLGLAEHYMDAAYVDALLLASEQKEGIETVGPARVDPDWQHRIEGAYSVDQFEIDWENEQITHPQGKIFRQWKALTRASGDPYLYAFEGLCKNPLSGEATAVQLSFRFIGQVIS